MKNGLYTSVLDQGISNIHQVCKVNSTHKYIKGQTKCRTNIFKFVKLDKIITSTKNSSSYKEDGYITR